MTAPSHSLAFRAALAVALMFGFYVVAIGFALGLLWLPYAEVVYVRRLHFQLAAFCIGGAFVILWAILPRPDRFKAPGPRLTAPTQPRLFETIQGVAKLTNQAMPAEVYLVPEVNAWVAQRGGVMGFGSRRVMGVGLPLLQVLSVSEFRAVLAHEFGHYYGGDTQLGPWIYKTRAAIGRTLQGLARHSSVLQAPFLWYAHLFLWISHAVSRQQELMADELAARNVGGLALAGGLKKVHGAALAYGPYWLGEVVPCLNAGYLPPVAEGFGRFVSSAAVARGLATETDRALTDRASDPYDSHPPLRERIMNLEALAPGDRADDDSPSISLLTEIDVLERGLLGARADKSQVDALKPVRWAEVGERIYQPMWSEVARRHRGPLVLPPVEALAGRAKDLADVLARVTAQAGDAVAPPAVRQQRGVWTLGVILADALVRRGWSLHMNPGEPPLLQGPLGTLEPLRVIAALVSGEMDAQAWSRRCTDLGIDGMSLASEERPEP